MNPETIIAAVTGIVMATVPEPYAGQLMTKLRDYFATLGQQSAEEAKTIAARENAAAAVAQVLPTIVDSPLPSLPLPTPATPPPVVEPPQPLPTTSELAASEPTAGAEQTPPAEEPTAPAPEPKPEPPKKNDGRNKAPVF